jgi:hypothetical protein
MVQGLPQPIRYAVIRKKERPMSYRRNGDTTRVMPPIPPQGSQGTPQGPRPPRGPRRGESWSPGTFSPAILIVGLLVVGILVAAGVVSQRGRLTTPAATAVDGQTSATATATAPANAARTFVVANTGGEGVYLRRTPRLADRDTAYVEGTQLVTIGADEQGEGQSWHHVRTPDGKTGYVPAQYTVEVGR